MLIEVLIELYERDLTKLKNEIAQYPDDADLWKTTGEVSNSAGNLCLHLTGNLKHFIGAVLGGYDYTRDRDSEFSTKGLTKDQLFGDIDQTAEMIRISLKGFMDDDLADNYPIEVFGKPMTTAFFLTHLTTHFNYHLGQINYHRRLLNVKADFAAPDNVN